jgi:starch-binding outer membrane protein, SusD/RagB family
MSFLVLSACEDYLDKYPLDQISQETFWKSKSDFDAALAANYRQLQNTPGSPAYTSYWAEDMPNWDCLTDNAYGKLGNNSSKEIVSGNITPSTGGYIIEIYDACYKGISRVNLFLNELASYNGNELSIQDKNKYEAEVRFIRGFYYFQLYWVYGEVPLILEPLTLKTQAQPKQSADKILEQILQDLDFAIANLNNVSYRENFGHVVVSSAQALKARVLVYAAYGNTGIPDIDLLTQVRDLCVQIQTSYTLSPNFEDIFKDEMQKDNPEIVFSINYLAPNNCSNWDKWQGSYVSYGPLQNFVDAFECTDGLPFGVSPLTNLTDPFQDRDPRLSKTVFKDFIQWSDGSTYIPSETLATGYGVMKYLNQKNFPSFISQQDAVVLRLGEVLLMYAEAQNEIVGPDASVYKAMEDLRARVNMPPFPADLSKDQMRERIRHERRIELAFEQSLRYFDLKRWRIAYDVLNNVTDGLLDYNFEEQFYLWPLPQPEIDKCNGILIQNPDY